MVLCEEQSVSMFIQDRKLRYILSDMGVFTLGEFLTFRQWKEPDSLLGYFLIYRLQSMQTYVSIPNECIVKNPCKSWKRNEISQYRTGISKRNQLNCLCLNNGFTLDLAFDSMNSDQVEFLHNLGFHSIGDLLSISKSDHNLISNLSSKQLKELTFCQAIAFRAIFFSIDQYYVDLEGFSEEDLSNECKYDEDEPSKIVDAILFEYDNNYKLDAPIDRLEDDDLFIDISNEKKLHKRLKARERTRNLRISRSDLDPLLEFVRSLLKDQQHVSVEKVYSEKIVSCHSIGIVSPELLYYAFQAECSDEIVLNNYPQIRSIHSYSIDSTHQVSIKNEIISYVKEKKAPCSYSELEDEFVLGRGYRQYYIYNTAQEECLYKYVESYVVHRETILWTPVKQNLVENIANELLVISNREGQVYALIEQIQESNKLPELPFKMVWTDTLLADILMRSENFAVLGTRKNAFVKIPNRFKIYSFEDLIHSILENNHNGVTSLPEFEEELRKKRILTSIIPKKVFEKGDRVILIGNSLMTKEVYNAERYTTNPSLR